MVEFEKGASVWVTGASDAEASAAEFVEIADPDETVVWRGRRRDAAWVQLVSGDDDGTTARVARSALLPRTIDPEEVEGYAGRYALGPQELPDWRKAQRQADYEHKQQVAQPVPGGRYEFVSYAHHSDEEIEPAVQTRATEIGGTVTIAEEREGQWAAEARHKDGTVLTESNVDRRLALVSVLHALELHVEHSRAP